MYSKITLKCILYEVLSVILRNWRFANLSESTKRKSLIEEVAGHCGVMDFLMLLICNES